MKRKPKRVEAVKAGIERPSNAIIRKLKRSIAAARSEAGLCQLVIIGKECWEVDDVIYWVLCEVLENRRLLKQAKSN